MLFFDAAKVTTRKKTSEGYLQVSALAGRPGIQNYSPADFPRESLPAGIRDAMTIKLLRPDNVVKDSATSFRMKPVTIEHPPEMVNASNVKKYQVGIVDGIEIVDGNNVRASLLVQDNDAIAVIDSGKEQVSLGYDAEISWESGTDETHGMYDGIMTAITGNHLAIVDRARAGSAYRLFDTANKQEKTMAEIKDAEVIRENEQLKIAVKDAKTEAEKLTASLTDAESRIATLAAELEETKKMVVTDAEINDRVEKAASAKLAVIDSARKAWDKVETNGKTTVEIQLAVIDHLTGGASKPDATRPELVAAVYDALIAAPRIKTEQLQNAIGTPVADGVSLEDSARAKMIARRGGKTQEK